MNLTLWANCLQRQLCQSHHFLTLQPNSGILFPLKAFLQLYPKGAILKNRPNIFGRVAPVIVAGAVFASVGCVRVKMDPIHITMDVNVKVDKELDSFFGDLDAKAATSNAPALNPAEK